MKCIIPGPNVKVLGRAIHSLAKLGEDLYVESSEKELFFRTVNSSKTAYASFAFSSNFFLFFHSEKSGCYGSVNCQIAMKSLLSIFKSPMSLEKTTESIQIQSPSNDNLIFIVKYKTGVLKTFKIPIVNCEALQAYYLKDSTPNSATLQPKIMWELLANLYNSQDEITWKVTKNNLIIKNFLEPEDECEGLRTEISVNKSEFDNFKIEKETEVTFCLKELRAVLLFSDGVSLPLTFNFSTSSKPIVFIIKSDSFEVNIVVSTLSGDTSECSTNFSLPGTINRLITSKNVDNGNLSGNQTEPIQLISSDSGSESASASASASSSGNDKGRDAERLKHIFGKCFQWEKYDVKNLPGYNVVIASDSDSDV